MKELSKEDQEAVLNKLLDRLKLDPKYELKQEFGKMLMRHIDSFTPSEMKRYNELKELLK